MALALLVSFQKQKQKHQYFARRHSLNTHFDNSKKQKRNRRGNKRIFFVPLVDTRSFFYFFIFLKILLCDKTSKIKRKKVKIKGYGTRFARVVSKAKAKSKA